MCKYKAAVPKLHIALYIDLAVAWLAGNWATKVSKQLGVCDHAEDLLQLTWDWL